MTQETQYDKALRGEWFIQGDPRLKAERDRAKVLCWELNQTSPADEPKRQEILRQLIGTVKGTFTINSPFYCDYGIRITIGDRFFANYNCKILDGGEVIFGDNVRIGPDCTFSTPHHPVDPQKRLEGWQIHKPIHVGDNVWFGSGVNVLPGVTIGSNTVIGAGSVVTRDIPAGVFAAGSPCRVIKKAEEEEDGENVMFTKAITKKPCRALIDGISTAQFGEGTPVYEDAVRQHDIYVETLRSLGLEVLDLEADERYPDSCFVEDPAVVMSECAIITNPARDSRNGEKYEIIHAVRKFYSEEQIFHIEAPGTLEGGDVMQVGKHFYVGLSDRTNEEGVRQFTEIVGQFGYEVTAVPVTEGLHLKDFAVYLDKGNLLVTAVMNEAPAFADFNRLVIDADELYAINSMYINGTVLVPEGYPKTLKIIEDLGYPVKLMNTGEFRKIDGSLTCLSLRF